jgi:hypothetical protein
MAMILFEVVFGWFDDLVDSIIEWVREFKFFLQKKPCWIEKVQYFAPAGEVDLDGTDGTRTIYEEEELFGGYRDSVFKSLMAAGYFSKKAKIYLEKLIKPGTLLKIFENFSHLDLEDLRLMQAQVVLFCEVYGAKIHRNSTHGMMFLVTDWDMPIKPDLSNLHFAYVYKDRNDKLIASHRFPDDETIWRAKHHDLFLFIFASPTKKR